MDENLEKRTEEKISIKKTSLDFAQGFVFGTMLGLGEQFILETAPVVNMSYGFAFFNSIGYYMTLNKKKYSDNARLSKSVAFYAGICTGTVIYTGVRNYIVRNQ